ncbi:MAG TPA: NADH-quinone oxidoreductase subunit NuoN [Steroidobacteraceae bacterium]|nr:NADH-quinone oxidoreductase subunit NuoN [Steroidobacteraceae bacterium]
MPDTTMTWASVAPAVGEIFLLFAICAVLLIDVFTGEKRRSPAPTLTLLVLVITAALMAAFGQVGTRVVLFDGMYVADPLSYVLKLAALLFVAVVLLYSRSYMSQRGTARGEYYVLVLTALLGIFVLASANNMLLVYIGVELLALSVYAMVAFDRDNGIAAEAAMKYFVLGAIASGMLIYGMSIIYGITGTLALDELPARLGASHGAGAILGLSFIVVAVAFKFGAVPFHMWLPDVYEGAPTNVTLFISTAPKIAYFSLALRLLTHGLAGTAADWSRMLGILAVLTIILGNVVAIAQSNLKRMLAYSAISNVGFIILGFVSGTQAGYAAALFYTLAYVLVTLGTFGVMLLLTQKGFEADRLDDYKGLASRDPLLALVMLGLMFSTAGVPPFVGFWAKLSILTQLWATGHLWLVIVAVVLSVVGAFYYLRIVKLMYFDPPTTGQPLPEWQPGVRLALGVNGLAAFVLGLLPGALLGLCGRLLS